MFKSFTKIIAISLITAMNWSGLSAVFGTVAYFTDSAEVSGITLTAGNLDFSASGSGFLPAALLPNDNSTATQTITLENTGSLDFQYQIAPRYDNANPLCGDLLIRDDPTATFMLLASYVPATSTLAVGAFATSSFEIKLFPVASNDASLQNRQCNLKMEITAWQTNFAAPAQGFVKTQTIANTITTGQWVPSLLSPANNAVINGAYVKQCWTPVGGATAYYYQSCNDADCSSERFHNTYDSVTELATACKTASGVANATYYWRVKAIIGNYVSSFSETRKITIDNTLANQVVLNEILPNPSDGNEWVELHNNTGEDADVNGWTLGANAGSQKISSADTYSGTTLLRSGGFLVARITGFYLDNYGDKVYLKNAAGTVIDSHIYDSANKGSLTGTPGYSNADNSSGISGGVPVDKSLARIPDGAANWVDPIPTPGEPNELSEAEAAEILQELQTKILTPEKSDEALNASTTEEIANAADGDALVETDADQTETIENNSGQTEDDTDIAADAEKEAEEKKVEEDLAEETGVANMKDQQPEGAEKPKEKAVEEPIIEAEAILTPDPVVETPEPAIIAGGNDGNGQGEGAKGAGGGDGGGSGDGDGGGAEGDAGGGSGSEGGQATEE